MVKLTDEEKEELNKRRWLRHMKIMEKREAKRTERNWAEHMKKMEKQDAERVEKNWADHMEKQNAKLEDHFEENWVGKDAYIKEMNIRKQRIIRQYGTEPTICFFHYLHNAVNYIGEKNLRKCFESLVGQGDEVIIGDYGSTDGTKELAKEYGFKVVDVEKVEGITLAQSKIKNKIIKETNCNFMVECDIHIEYPKNITDIIRDWIRHNPITKKMLVLRGPWINKDGVLQREYSFGPAVVFYTPYLIEARGYDERCYMGYGGTHYGVSLMLDVYRLEFDDQHLDTMIHKYHIREKTNMLKYFYDINKMGDKHFSSVKFGKGLARRLVKGFDEEVKNVQNSYW